jgi:hypothetical protein
MLVSHYPNVSINTANPPTEMARRDAVRRDLFEPVTEAEKTAIEKPVLTDDKSRAAGSNTTGVNLYDANGKETETQQAVEGRDEQASDQQEGKDSGESEQSPQQEARQQQAEEQEQQEVEQLRSRDQEVKTHEQAHAAVGGRYAGAPNYTYELGPDGKQYAVGGEVQIDVAPVAGDPRATVQKMQQVQAAALAPAEPSAADRRIAAQAAQQQVQAQAELVKQNAVATSAPSESGAKNQAFSETDAQADISYRVSDGASSGIVYPQRETLAITAQMQLRRSVIASFYQRATEPQVRQSLQQA